MTKLFFVLLCISVTSSKPNISECKNLCVNDFKYADVKCDVTCFCPACSGIYSCGCVTKALKYESMKGDFGFISIHTKQQEYCSDIISQDEVTAHNITIPGYCNQFALLKYTTLNCENVCRKCDRDTICDHFTDIARRVASLHWIDDVKKSCLCSSCYNVEYIFAYIVTVVSLMYC